MKKISTKECTDFTILTQTCPNVATAHLNTSTTHSATSCKHEHRGQDFRYNICFCFCCCCCFGVIITCLLRFAFVRIIYIYMHIHIYLSILGSEWPHSPDNHSLKPLQWRHMSAMASSITGYLFNSLLRLTAKENEICVSLAPARGIHWVLLTKPILLKSFPRQNALIQSDLLLVRPHRICA